MKFSKQLSFVYAVVIDVWLLCVLCFFTPQRYSHNRGCALRYLMMYKYILEVNILVSIEEVVLVDFNTIYLKRSPYHIST